MTLQDTIDAATIIADCLDRCTDTEARTILINAYAYVSVTGTGIRYYTGKAK